MSTFSAFPPIVVSFSAYLIIFTPDKMLLISQLTLTSLLTFVSKLKLRQDSWFYSHPGLHAAGGNLQVPCKASPPGICLLSTSNNHFSLL